LLSAVRDLLSGPAVLTAPVRGPGGATEAGAGG
jgi:hypothetical protein